MFLHVTWSAERLDRAKEKTGKKQNLKNTSSQVLSGDILFENKGIVRLLIACVYFDSFCQRECRCPRLGVLWNDTCRVFQIGKADFLYKNSMSARYKVQTLPKLGIHLPFFRPPSCHCLRLFRPRLVTISLLHSLYSLIVP